MQKLTLNSAELSCLFRQDPSTKGDGGFQGLLVRLQRQTDRSTGVISLDAKVLERIPRYAFDYKQGGWEDRLLNIFSRTLGNRLGR
jgi:hypothetical protein